MCVYKKHIQTWIVRGLATWLSQRGSGIFVYYLFFSLPKKVKRVYKRSTKLITQYTFSESSMTRVCKYTNMGVLIHETMQIPLKSLLTSLTVIFDRYFGVFKSHINYMLSQCMPECFRTVE